MAREDRDPGGFQFQPEDEVDELFAGASPNPQRIGCPGEDVLRAAAQRRLPIEHQAYMHLAECSECYREFRGYQEESRRPSRRPALLAAAAVVLIAVLGGTYAGKRAGVGPWSDRTQTVMLDYRGESATRSESGDAARAVRTLPQANVDLTVLAPVGSEVGAYEVRLVDNDGRAVVSRAAQGRMEDFALKIRVSLDLRSIPRGSYSFEIRRVDEDWDPHPVVIR